MSGPETVAVAIDRAEIRRKFPGRPKVRGDHYGIWAWRGKACFTGEIAGKELDGIHRHAERSFPESAFGELLEAGFEFVRWASA